MNSCGFTQASSNFPLSWRINEGNLTVWQLLGLEEFKICEISTACHICKVQWVRRVGDTNRALRNQENKDIPSNNLSLSCPNSHQSCPSPAGSINPLGNGINTSVLKARAGMQWECSSSHPGLPSLPEREGWEWAAGHPRAAALPRH